MEEIMLNSLTPYGPQWGFQSIDTHYGWKQNCEMDQCLSRSRVRFVIYNKQYNATRIVCSSCAANLTGMHAHAFSVCETCVNNLKPHFQTLRNLNGLRQSHQHSHKNMTGYLSINIGDQHVYISEFNSGRYLLSINRKPIHPNLNYKAFKSKKRVAEFAIETVNNYYKSRMINHVLFGTPFVMP